MTPEKVPVQKTADAKISINKDSSFLDKLSIAAANSTKETSTTDIKAIATETNMQDDNSISKVKSILTDAGFTQKEIDSIKNLKDLKELLISKASDGTLKAGEDLAGLLSSLLNLLGGKASESFTDIKKLCDSVLPQIKTAVNKAVNNGGTVDALKSFQNEADNILIENKQAIENLKPEDLKLFKAVLTNEVKNDVKNAINNAAVSDVKSIINKSAGSEVNNVINNTAVSEVKNSVNNSVESEVKSLINNVSANETKDVTENAGIKTSSSDLINVTSELSLKIQKEITTILNKYKSENSVIKLNQVIPDIKSTIVAQVQNTNKGQLADKKSFDDSSILNKLAEPDKKSSKIDKVTSFMAQFTNTAAPAKTISAEKPTIDISTINADIVKSLKFMEQGDIKNLTVKITPKELGDVIINLTMENGAMKASITASNKEAYNLINSNMADINARLQNSNMAVQDLSLNIYNQDTTFFKNGSQGQPHEQANHNGNGKTISIMDAAEAIVNQSMLNSNVNILA